jgi:hypothetical protein
VTQPSPRSAAPQPSTHSAAPNASSSPSGSLAASRRGRSLRFWVPAIVIVLAMLGSLAFIGYVVLRVEDEQIPLMASGFVVLGASFGAVAIWSLFGMWRAASRARGGRAFLLAIVGGLAGLGAIGCFTVTALSMLVWNT